MARFIDLIQTARFHIVGDNGLVFTVREPLLRQYFESWVATANGVSDSSFNKDLVKVSRPLLAEILLERSGGKPIDDLIRSLPGGLPEEADRALRTAPDSRAFFRTMLDKLVAVAADEAVRGLAQGALQLAASAVRAAVLS